MSRNLPDLLKVYRAASLILTEMETSFEETHAQETLGLID